MIYQILDFSKLNNNLQRFAWSVCLFSGNLFQARRMDLRIWHFFRFPNKAIIISKKYCSESPLSSHKYTEAEHHLTESHKTEKLL